MSWSDLLRQGTADPNLTFAREKWAQPGKFVWVAPWETVTAPTGKEYPLCTTVCLKDADDVVKPYQPSMDGMREADDWYVGSPASHLSNSVPGRLPDRGRRRSGLCPTETPSSRRSSSDRPASHRCDEHGVKLGVFLTNSKTRRAKLPAGKLAVHAALGLEWAA
ncbi:Thoeris anti-defense Tad2 family protein [Streptomyces clavifer]|uniref:Thoeris anti-defense Tad2 family protein n=1 Tax=Streptomyces clavifer TaxID=68188 RepID=UPI0036A4B65C